jgi:predicted hydrolase (HD superfamily)
MSEPSGVQDGAARPEAGSEREVGAAPVHVPSPEEALELVDRYNAEEYHRVHARIVGAVMRWFAAKYDAGNEDYWYAVGALHDVDFERYPERHCVAGEEILRAEGIDPGVIRSAMSHGWGGTDTPYEPESLMEKVLFATDELTGLIYAAIRMRPSKSTLDMDVKSVKKKFKDKRFAAGCSREVISNGAERLGWTLDELIDQTLQAMQEFERSQGGMPGITVELA